MQRLALALGLGERSAETGAGLCRSADVHVDLAAEPRRGQAHHARRLGEVEHDRTELLGTLVRTGEEFGRRQAVRRKLLYLRVSFLFGPLEHLTKAKSRLVDVERETRAFGGDGARRPFGGSDLEARL